MGRNPNNFHLLPLYTLTHKMIFNINMFRSSGGHGIRRKRDAALIIFKHQERPLHQNQCQETLAIVEHEEFLDKRPPSPYIQPRRC